MGKFKAISIFNIVILIFIFSLHANYYNAFSEPRSNGIERYYFNSYENMANFFEKPTMDKNIFACQQTPFHADVYQTQILDEIVTGFLYESCDQTFYKIVKIPSNGESQTTQVVTGKSDIYPLTEHSESDKQCKPSDDLKKPTWPTWKVIAPGIKKEINSIDFRTDSPSYHSFWDGLKKNGYACDVALISGSNGRHSLQLSLGNMKAQNFFMLYQQEQLQKSRNTVAHFNHLYHNCPWILLQALQKDFRNRLKHSIKKLQNKMPIYERKVCELLLLSPPVQSSLAANASRYEMLQYLYAQEAHRWLYKEISSLNSGLTHLYWGNIKRIVKAIFGTPSEKKMVCYAEHFVTQADRIINEFYRKFPNLKKQPLTAIALSHPLTHQLSLLDSQKLEGLKTSWGKALNLAREHGNQELQYRYKNRKAALKRSLQSLAQPYDYSKSIISHAPYSDPDAHLFDNCYGSQLDHQLHQELCGIRQVVYELKNEHLNNHYIQTYAHLINATTAQAKAERCPDRAYSLTDFSYELVTLASRGISFLSSQAARTACSLANTDVKTCTVAAGKAACAVTNGIAQGFATTLNPRHWYDMAVGTAGMLQFLGHILKEQAWLDDYDAQRWGAFFTRDEKLYDELIARFEKHGATDIQKFNAQFDKSCQQLAALSWDQLLENGAAFGTTLVLDAISCHAASYAAAQAGRAFVQTVSELVSAPQAQAAEHMIEIAGLGKIALDQGAKVAATSTQHISKNSEIIKQSGKSFVQEVKNIASDVHPSTPVGRRGMTPEYRIQEGLRKSTVIHGREYSAHAVKRMQERGYIPALTEDIIKNGIKSQDPFPERLRHYDLKNNILVVTDKNSGTVITIRDGTL